MIIPRMAEQLGIGERQVRRLLASLKDQGAFGAKDQTNRDAGLLPPCPDKCPVKCPDNIRCFFVVT